MKKLILILSIVLTASFAVQAQTNRTVDGPQIKFDKTVHDFGTIKHKVPVQCEFKLKNTGNQPLIISDIVTSCGCTVPKWKKEPIFPGQSTSIIVHYDADEIKPINNQITVLSNAIQSTILLVIKGEVKE